MPEVPLLDRVYEALVAQLRDEQSKGLGSEPDYVFTSLTGRPLGRGRLSKRGVLGAASGPSGMSTHRRFAVRWQRRLRMPQVPVVVAAAMTGHSPGVYSAHYARPFRDAEEREKVWKSLAAIGFGNTAVDQPVEQRPI